MSYSITEKYFNMLNYFKHFTVVLFLLGGVLLTMSLQSSFLPQNPLPKSVLFVSRQIPCCGSVYMSAAKALPGIGGFSKYQVAAPAFLCILNPDNSIDTLIDGSRPESNPFQLIDISSPCLSWDAKKIVFAGLKKGNYVLGNNNMTPAEPNAWRIYIISVDGRNLSQVSFDEASLNLNQFNPFARGVLKGYDDTHPIWLPDGRICFSSTRFPGIGMYNVTRTSNLYVINENGTGLHRITSDKNGADKPVVDPVTGKIVFARWWRNFYWPYDPMTTKQHPVYTDGWSYKDGLTSYLDSTLDGQSFMFNNNAFLLTEINPDGTEMKLFSAHYREVSNNNAYGGCFDVDGNFIGNWFPIEHQSESSGFGGLKRYYRGTAKRPVGLIGVYQYGNFDYYVKDPPSYGIFKGSYAAEPSVTSDGTVLFSMAKDPNQDYGIYIMNADGSSPQLVYDHPGTTELNAQIVEPRKLPKILLDKVSQVADPLPPTGIQDLRKEGSFEFDCRNIFFNSPIDDGIIAAPAVGNMSTVRFYAAPLLNQQYGSLEMLDYPLLYNEINVDAYNRVFEKNAPAHVPLFEQGRSSTALGYKVPRTGGGIMDGAAHVTGFNYGRPGQHVTCVGCHAGHSVIPVPNQPDELFFTNLAPGAKIMASSSMNSPGNVIDKKNRTANQHWFTPEGVDPMGQWLKLKWLEPIYVKQIKLYNIPDTNRLRVEHCIVRLYADSSFKQLITSIDVNEKLSNMGTLLALNQVEKIQSMQVEFIKVAGGIYHWNAASLGEVEVISSNIDPATFKAICDCKGSAYGPYKLDSCGHCLLPEDPKFNDCLTHLDRAINGHKVLVYQDHIQQKIRISILDDIIETSDQIRLWNINGQSIPVWISYSDGDVTIDLSSCKAGIYFLSLVKDHHNELIKFIKW
ncbi:MAG TPA: hypothetical protein PLD02_01515 [Saprospiraceae bacterium]|nr:hypothetical protein [Saprospiraceae bacterium]